MKNRAVISYIVKVVIFSAVYFIAVGPVRSFLYGKMGIEIPEVLFNTIYFYREPLISSGYVLGLIFIALYDITKFQKLILVAADALGNKNSEVYSTRCPYELKEFAEKLIAHDKEIGYAEQARILSEQQKQELVMYLAHDLKTPLTSVIGYLSILADSPDISSEQRKKYTSIALSKAYRLEELTDQFFDMTRLSFSHEALQKRKVNLSHLIGQLSEEFYALCNEKKMSISKDISPGIEVFMDADKMVRVFDNIIKNAINYGYEDSTIFISLKKDAGNAVVSISNTGDEIPDEKLRHIFDKFVRLDSSRNSSAGGSGLGLYIARQIALMHGGDITAVKNKNEITFTVYIPI